MNKVIVFKIQDKNTKRFFEKTSFFSFKRSLSVNGDIYSDITKAEKQLKELKEKYQSDKNVLFDWEIININLSEV